MLNSRRGKLPIDLNGFAEMIQTTKPDASIREILETAQKARYYEYSVKSIIDEGGRTNIQKLTDLLNQMGLAGWKLATTHTNELGKNALMAIGLGINSTVDETILIFERFVKI